MKLVLNVVLALAVFVGAGYGYNYFCREKAGSALKAATANAKPIAIVKPEYNVSELKLDQPINSGIRDINVPNIPKGSRRPR